MSSKRRADKYLTHDNWDQEEVSEEAGKFEPASKDILMKRTFKKAKRRIAQPGEVCLFVPVMYCVIILYVKDVQPVVCRPNAVHGMKFCSNPKNVTCGTYPQIECLGLHL